MYLHGRSAFSRAQLPRWRVFATVLTTVALTICATSAWAKEALSVDGSPYFVPGVSNTPFNFSGIGAERSGAFRVLGARTNGLSLTFSHAEATCRELEGGRGLAIVNTGQRRQAANQAILHSLV
jgi:hypothetical protein